MSAELQTTQPSRIERAETFAPRNLAEAFSFASMVLESGMAPKSYLEIYTKAIGDNCTPEVAARKAESAVVVALQFGMEVGFQPMQALQCIANINGNPSVWGDGALALVQSSGLMEWIREEDLEAIKANTKATCSVKRRGDPEVKTVTFSYDDARKGGIFDRGVWKSYPHRMCMMRARAFALRDKFPDVLKGLKIAEEVMDYVEPDGAPEPAKIAATVVVPTADKQEPKPAAAAAATPATTEAVTESSSGQGEVVPRTITIDQAKDFYKTYSSSRWLAEEARAWLKEKYPYTGGDSRKTKPEDFGDIMAWANTKKGSEPKEPWTGKLENMEAETPE